jgi:hypothetical protein
MVGMMDKVEKQWKNPLKLEFSEGQISCMRFEVAQETWPTENSSQK